MSLFDNQTYKLFKRILHEGKPYIIPFAFLGAIGLVMVPVELYGLLLTRKMIDQGFLAQNWELTRNIVILLVLLFGTRSAISYISTLFSARLQLQINQKYQDRIFSHLLCQPMHELVRQPTGRLMSRILDDGTLFSTIFDQAFGKAIQQPIKVIVLTGVLIYFNFRLWAVLLFSAVLSIMVIRWLGIKLHAISKLIQSKDADIYSYLEQRLTNIELIKSHTDEHKTASGFRQHLDEFIQLSLKIQKITLVTGPILQALKYLGIGAVLLYGSWMVSDGVLTVGTLTTFLGTAYLFFNTVFSLGNLYGSLRANLARMEAVYAILDAPIEGKTIETVLPKPVVVKKLSFDNVVFGYDPTVPVLKGVSLNIKAGVVFGITGQSGSGKTTLLRLMVRFYDPDSGDVRLDDQSIRNLGLKELRSSIGIVFQENFILDDTIRNNIAFGKTDLAEKQVRFASQMAGAHSFIMSLPNQYQTVVGERGQRLSGGQRQRLAIARAIAADPAILILDESTSFLELTQELNVLQNLKRHRLDKITIIVSHRLSAMKHADRIVTLDNGRILETDYQALINAVKVA
jgi:subfamily B ATP-binding cassette protein MsbA